MNKLLIAIGVIAVLAVISAIIISCSMKAKAKNLTVPDPEEINENEDIIQGAGDSVTDFRFESFIGKAWINSDVYSLSLNDGGSYLYWRKSGNFNGKGMGYFDAGDIYSEFEKTVKEFSLDQYPYTPFDKENKDRDRFLIRVKYKDGHQISIVNYLDNPVAEKDQKLMENIRGIFEMLFKYIEDNNIRCKHSKYTYDSKGKLNRRIDYTSDGIVHGGWDADDPLATF